MIRTALAASLAFGLALAAPAQAADCTLGSASAADPHRTDGTNDYAGVVFGGGSTLGPGDVYREGIDLTGVWIDAPAADTNRRTTFHIGLQNFSGLEFNATYYVLFTYENPDDPSDDIRARRYVGFQISERGQTTGSYGYLDQSGPVGLYTQTGTVPQGSATFTSTELRIAGVPLRSLGNPPAGAELAGLTAESRILVGARGTGLLFVADTTTNGDGCDSLTV